MEDTQQMQPVSWRPRWTGPWLRKLLAIFMLSALLAAHVIVQAEASASPDQQKPLFGNSEPDPPLYGPERASTSTSSGSGAGGRPSPFTDGFRALVADTLASWHVPGVAVAVLDGDETWLEGFGTAQFAGPSPSSSSEDDVPVTPHTLFYTASNTKAFVAAALSLLVDSGNYTVGGEPGDGSSSRLSWQTPLSTILGDDFVIADDPWATAHLTVEDALAHRTGLAAHDLSRSRRYGLAAESRGRNATVRDVTRSLRHLPLSSSPRTTYRYSNLMYLVLSHVVETLTGGTWLGDVLRDRIWVPLGMAETFLSLGDARAAVDTATTAADKEQRPFLAQGYYYEEPAEDEKADRGRYVAVPHMPLEEVSGAGGVISSAADYAKWVRCWLDGPHASASASSGSSSKDACGGIPFTKPGLDFVLAPKVFMAHTAASPDPWDAPLAYCSGWAASSYKGHRYWGHSGGSNAFGSQVYFFPDDRYGVVILGNTAVTSNAAEMILLWHLAAERFGVPPDQRYDWDAAYRGSAARRRARVDGALDGLYPHRTRPPLPPSLPLKAYVGTYHHPAYQNLTLRLVEEREEEEHKHDKEKQTGKRPPYKVTFVADRHAHTWPTRCEFVHVSGDHWLLYTDMLYERSGRFKSYGRAEFRIGAAGSRPDAVEVEFWNADEDLVEGAFSFARLSEEKGT